MPRILLAAGGTGGHMFPAQALATILKNDGWEIALMTDARGEKHAGAIGADPVISVPLASIRPSKPHKIPGGLIKLLGGVRHARSFIKSWQPDIVMGFGGYPAFPALKAAQSLGVPTALHEQNAVLGRVNRVFAKRAEFVASGFERLDRLPAGTNWTVIGNPLRAPIRSAAKRAYRAPDHNAPINLLVVGGSLGSSIVSTVSAQAVIALPKALRDRLHVVQQARAEDIEHVRASYEAAGVSANCAPFFHDIEQHLAKAHFIIARAGASSLSEIALMGLPSLLIPLAIAMDDHQRINAEPLKRLGAADILPENAFTADVTAKLLQERLTDAAYLDRASKAAKSASQPDAAVHLAELVKTAVSK